MNLDACRVAANGDKLGGGMVSKGCPKSSEGWDRPWMHDKKITDRKKIESAEKVAQAEALGRFPPHLLHDGSEIVKKCFPESGPSGWRKTGKTALGQASGWNKHENKELDCVQYNESGSASRFFPSLPYDEEDCATIHYCAKASKRDRDDGCDKIQPKSGYDVTGRSIESTGLLMDGGKQNPYAEKASQINHNFHVSVKPTNLMRWLCRLLTPKGGTLLDPFMGSGSTLKAAVLENFACIGIEMDEDYFAIAEARVAHVSPEIVEVKHVKRSIQAKQQASFF